MPFFNQKTAVFHQKTQKYRYKLSSKTNIYIQSAPVEFSSVLRFGGSGVEGVGRENYSIYTWGTDQTPQRKAKTGRKCCRSSRASLYCYSMQGVHIARSSERIRHEERQGDTPPQLPALRELEGSTEGRASSNCVGIFRRTPPREKGSTLFI